MKTPSMENIWDEWYRPLAAFIRTSYGLGAETEDLMQEIMLKVHRNLPCYDGRHALSTWLYTITRNTCLDWLSVRRIKTEDLSWEPPAKGSLEGAFLSGEIERTVQATLAGCDATDRGIAWLAFYEKAPYRHIALVFDLPLHTIKNRVFALRHLLKTALEDYHA